MRNQARPSICQRELVRYSDIAVVAFVLYGGFMLAVTIWEVCR